MSWGNPTNFIEKCGQAILAPVACAYQAVTCLRAFAYNGGILKQVHLSAKVISIGNITVGGTGKTPIVIDMAKRYVQDGYKVAILSRGYKRKSKAKVVVVSDGAGNFAGCEESGDEPYLIAKCVPEAVVLVGSKRVVTGQMAVEKFGCNLILLDDGFQHRALYRDEDIVLTDYLDDPDNDAPLPAGRLRESLSSLGRATYIVITKVPQNPDQTRLSRLRSSIAKYAPQAKILSCRFTTDCFVSLNNQNPVSDLKGQRLVAFCGIARPENFFDSLAELGVAVEDKLAFPDHHWFTFDDMSEINKRVKASSAEASVTTAKDGVRIPPELAKAFPIYVLNITTNWLDGMPSLMAPNPRS